MPVDYDAIIDENMREHDALVERVGAFLSGMYSDQTHFILELLQNAEDVNATQVIFRLYRDRLEFEHDGGDFNVKDIKAICKLVFGTKGNDPSKAGKFGVGFMSVYSFTRSPSIHSGDEHFTIENYEQPRTTQSENSELGTLFVFPFDHLERQPEDSYDEISARLQELDVRTILFLRHIREITYEIENGDSGSYRTETDKELIWNSPNESH